MALAIITGAHLFPYAWYYKTTAYAIMAGVISIGATVVGFVANNSGFAVAIFMVAGLTALVGFLWIAVRRNEHSYNKLRQQ